MKTPIKENRKPLKILWMLSLIVILFLSCASLQRNSALEKPTLEYGWLPEGYIFVDVTDDEGVVHAYPAKFMIKEDVEKLSVFIATCEN